MKLEDLKLYQECLDFEQKVWNIVNQWDEFNKDTVGKQFIQSSDAISGNIAAGYGRYNFKDKKHYCYISRGYLLKTKGWLIKSKERELVAPDLADELLEVVEKIHRMLNAYIRSIGRKKTDEVSNNTSENSYDNNKNRNTGNSYEEETEKDGNSFTADADEFFSAEELTSNA